MRRIAVSLKHSISLRTKSVSFAAGEKMYAVEPSSRMQRESSAVCATSACRVGIRASLLGEGGGERERSGVRCVSSEAVMWVTWALKYRGR